MNVVINGLGTANDENVTGIQRVCRELTLRLDELLKNEPEIHAEYLSKTGAKNVVVAPSDLHNIEFCELDGQKNKINALFRFPRYVKKRGAVAVAFSHELTCVKNSVVCVHDVRPLRRRSKKLTPRRNSQFAAPVLFQSAEGARKGRRNVVISDFPVFRLSRQRVRQHRKTAQGVFQSAAHHLVVFGNHAEQRQL